MVDQDWIELTRDAIDVGAAYARLVDPACGGVCLFVGTTRDSHEGRPVEELSYEAYETMAKTELEGLASQLRERFPAIVKLSLIHRLGVVPLAEASVLIAAATPHRPEAFEACRAGIDELKARVPIWKKESYRDGSSPAWVSNKESLVPTEGPQEPGLRATD
ncbi:MAG: molybdenum cofactor biosynthesis protein MoaE [Planctomycetes bacterium]|nr:molybdenum cofactor biosynthesis protein MoaE [Planctomycetota bacterium]